MDKKIYIFTWLIHKFKPMRTIFTFSLIIFMNLAIMAQPTLIGARFVPTNGNEIVRWSAMDLSTIETFQTDLQGYMLSSSLFDAYNGNLLPGWRYLIGGLPFLLQQPDRSDGLCSFSCAFQHHRNRYEQRYYLYHYG